jgi:beta-glucosidase
VFIGYRAWQRSATAPRYPFGHGEGYTSWAYDSIVADGTRVTVTVRNTGPRPGREVVQLYVGPGAGSPVADGEAAARPDRWLAAFAAVTAGPGETVEVTADLPARAFQIWDGAWRTVPGAYVIEAGHSSADRRVAATAQIT